MAYLTLGATSFPSSIDSWTSQVALTSLIRALHVNGLAAGILAIEGVLGTAKTLGSVLFAGTSGNYTQDNANFFWDNTNKRLGIGNTAPSVALDITGAGKTSGAFTVGNALTVSAGSLVVSAAGSHAIGGAVDTDVQLFFRGTMTGVNNIYGIYLNSTFNVPVNGVGMGFRATGLTLNKAGSGTHADFTTMQLDAPTIGAGAAALTNATTLKITGAPTVGTNKYDLWCASTTAGAHRFDGGTTGAQTATFTATNKPGSGTTSPDTWLPVTIDGTLHYIPAFL